MPDELPKAPDDQATEFDPPQSSAGSGVGPRLVERFMAEFRGGFSSGSMLDKLNTNQINKLLDQTNEESCRQHDLDLQQNRMTFVLLLSIPILVLLLCFVFLHYGKGDLLREIIALLVGLGGGGAGGYTLGRASRRRTDV